MSAFIVAQQRRQPLGIDRSTDQITLDLIALMLLEERQLLLIFNPLGHHFQTQAMGHGDNGTGDCRILGAFAQAANERLIDFHVIHRENA